MTTQDQPVTGDDEPTIPSLTDPTVQDDPFEAYALMHRHCPVHQDGGQYVVAGYDDVKRVLTDPATFSSAFRGRRPSASHQAAAAVMAERGWVRANTLQRTDPPVHTHYRRLLGRVFTRRNVNRLRPRIEEIANELIDGFVDTGECEFITDFALPLPGIVICEQLGLDATQYPTFKRWADAMLASAQRPLTEAEAIEQAEIELEAQHHLAAEFEARRADPSDDLISMLANAHRLPDDDAVTTDGATTTDDTATTGDAAEADQPLTIEELQDLMHQLITGGFETTTTALTTGLWLLIRYPEQMAKLRDDRNLLANFIDESLRFDSPVAGLWRTSTCPVPLGDVDIAEESTVMVRYAAANRDPSRFENPDLFDIERANANEHMAFGFGDHYCIGAWLARTELEVGFTAVLDRLDDIGLARPLDAMAHEPSMILRPMKSLPIRFSRR